MHPGLGQASGAAAHEDATHQSTTQAQALFGAEVAAASLAVRTKNVARKSIGGSELPGLPGAPEGEHATLCKHSESLPAPVHQDVVHNPPSYALAKLTGAASGYGTPTQQACPHLEGSSVVSACTTDMRAAAHTRCL